MTDRKNSSVGKRKLQRSFSDAFRRSVALEQVLEVGERLGAGAIDASLAVAASMAGLQRISPRPARMLVVVAIEAQQLP